jgi:hypothetical protein
MGSDDVGADDVHGADGYGSSERPRSGTLLAAWGGPRTDREGGAGVVRRS